MAWLLLVHLPAVLVAPGAVVLGYTPLGRRVSASVRLPLAVVMSLFVAYLIGMCLWWWGLKSGAEFKQVQRLHWALAGGYGLSLLAALPVLARWLRHKPTRHMALATTAVVGWVLVLQCLPRIFAGGMWAIDWLEHIDRARFFRNGLPLDHQFLGLYSLPARPPVVNVVMAHFMAVHNSMLGYQVALAAINLTVVLPALLWARYFAGRARSRRAIWLAAAAMALSPMIVVNTLFAWTKLATGTFVLLGVYLCYVEFVRREGKKLADQRSEGVVGGVVWGFVWGYAVQAAGILVHYSAAPFAVVTGLMFLCGPLWRLRRGWTTLAVILLTCAVILLTWLVPSTAIYGARGTFASNTTVIDTAQQTLWQNIEKVGVNVWASLLPHPLTEQGKLIDAKLIQANWLTYLRDYYHHVCQTSLPGMVGVSGTVVLVLMLAGAIRRISGFWWAFMPPVILLGIAVHGTLSPAGVAHICLQPVALMAVACLAGMAARGVLPGAYRVMWLVGILVDVLLGVLLAVWCLTLVPPGLERVPAGQADLAGYVAIQDRNVLEANNWSNKVGRGLKLIGDDLAGYHGLIWCVVWVGVAVWICVIWRGLFDVGRPAPTLTAHGR